MEVFHVVLGKTGWLGVNYMSILQNLLRDVPIPQMVKIRQKFDDSHIENIDAALKVEWQRAKVSELVKPGMEIAVAVGSRGIDRIAAITKATVAYLQELGAKPFIVPAMGSHGGATAEGQCMVLQHLGITEASVGAEIRSSMNVEQIGELQCGLPVYMDRHASLADGIVVINRVKPHTAFRGPVESGLLKMISIGLGKQKGAEAVHLFGFQHMAENVPAMAKVMLQKRPILFGIATVENAFDKAAIISVVTPDRMEQEEIKLLQLAKEMMPRFYFDQIDVLIVDEIGKDISGDGMDPNVTGRYGTPYAHGGPDVNKIVVRDLSKRTGSIGFGIGMADLTTQRLVDKISTEEMYVNALTTGNFAPTKIPTVLPNDKLAIQAAIKSANLLDLRQVRLVRIKNTLTLSEILVSEAMLSEVSGHPLMELAGGPQAMKFDADGYLLD